ncbi:MAG: alpha-L-fucosidase [Bacteroidota bacterium]
MKKSVSLFYCIVCSLSLLHAQDIAKTPKAIMDDFMSKRFGMFIHFGPVTLRGTEIGWSRNKQVSQSDYDSLYKEFNPVLFDAEKWVKTAKDAGMKYLTITSKHHDGFCLWPTAYSPYNISNSPFKKDIVGALAAACKKYGIAFCIYFTVLDWHDADYPIHNPYDSTKNVTGNMTAFVARMKNELKELITAYHPYMLWFDGYWEKPWTAAYGKEIYSYIKSINSNIIINNRLGKEPNSLHNDQNVGDYLTPEQEIGKLDMTQPWESCITIANQWAWKPNDAMKSVKECIQTLVKTSAGNGNLLLNTGPMMDGRMEARQINLLKEMGNWLRLYGESIYGTKGGPYPPNSVYAATRKGNKIYLHIFERKDNSLVLPALTGVKITKAFLLSSNAEIKFNTDSAGIHIDLPGVLPDSNVSVIVLQLDKTAEEIAIIK